MAIDTINDAKTHMAARRLFGSGLHLSPDLLLAPNSIYYGMVARTRRHRDDLRHGAEYHEDPCPGEAGCGCERQGPG
ncbi:hypothetical protein [Mesorhizobium sp. WSM2240]|uniref:Uncharacterized protein n=1 Tax=Mesorhizobium sp. WSM2240 TaxID=3228851 RepID=A0AAU8CXL3_9HYPH